jgi:ribosomal protein S18 acetylase RimI-like enzyme
MLAEGRRRATVASVQIVIREARRSDEAFLSEMLYEAATWRPVPPRSSFEDVLSRPEIAVYIEAWGRPGDEGFVAEAATGELVGAAWYRFFSQEAHGFGFVDAETPEITIAIRAELRGRGIGTALLDALITRARERGVPALSLSVEHDNPASRLYEREAFRVVQSGDVLTMIREIAS